MDLCHKSDNELIYIAAKNGNMAEVSRLLFVNRDLDLSYQFSKSELTALAASVQEGYCSIVSILLRHGADPEVTVKEGGTTKSLLHVAAAAGHCAIVKLLLRYGAGPHIAYNNWTSLGNTVKLDRRVLQLLCNAGGGHTLLSQFKLLRVKPHDHIVKRNIAVINSMLAEREKYKEVPELLDILCRGKALQREIIAQPSLIHWTQQRIEYEQRYTTAINTIPLDCFNIATAGIILQNHEKLAATYSLLEEDCVNLPMRRAELLQELPAVCDYLQATHQFGYLSDFTVLRNFFEQVSLN